MATHHSYFTALRFYGSRHVIGGYLEEIDESLSKNAHFALSAVSEKRRETFTFRHFTVSFGGQRARDSALNEESQTKNGETWGETATNSKGAESR